MKLHLILAIISMASALPEIEFKLQNLAPDQTANIMVTLAARTHGVLEKVNGRYFQSRGEKLNAIHDDLVAHATRHQAPVLAALSPFKKEIDTTSFWITNQIFISGATSRVIKVLSKHPHILKIEAQFSVHLNPHVEQTLTSSMQVNQAGTTTYGVAKIQAPAAWDLGYTGKGILVASIDTGVNANHTFFNDRFLQKYGWYDATMDSTMLWPKDTQGHGTHTMGTMVGGYGYGVAPGATWATCKGCATLSCLSNHLIACGQFFMCPFSDDSPLGPTNPLNHRIKNCTMAPKVISCSWGGSGNSTFFSDIDSAWKAGGINGIFAAGNDGANGCGSTSSPGDQSSVVGVGATNEADYLTSYSSLGPSTNPNVKPDIVAPGDNVVSASYSNTTGTATMSGTSMATPHVAGTVALMLSKNSKLTPVQVTDILIHTADQTNVVGRGLDCGGIKETTFPNYALGWGRVNALGAVNAVPVP